jgi:carbon-monoxide dehydrogenase medium subunit
MKPAPFEYFRPRSVEEALALLAEHGGDAKPLAGGQSLIPAMNFRLATPAVLVDLNGLSELTYIADGSGDVRIGAMTRQRAVERSGLVSARVPLIAETMPHIAHPAIRNRGTIGGSLAHADPAAELPAVMLSLNASFTVSSQAGNRQVSADEFFVSLFSTAVQSGELLTFRRRQNGAASRSRKFREGTETLRSWAQPLL